MNVLVLNCGSATLKFDVVSAGDKTQSADSSASGLIEHIGSVATLVLDQGERRTRSDVTARSYGEALDVALGALDKAALLGSVAAVGHRVVHGGGEFIEPVIIDGGVIEGIRRVSDLAPLHNARSLEVIEKTRERLDMPMVACFDTAFFADLPAAAATYALPATLMRKHGIRRFGFHGIAHAYMARRYRELRPEVATPRLITLQLGSGCSVTASVGGRPVRTSMGYTPLEGLVMGTRSGNIDPALALRLPELTGLSAGEVEDLLNKQSGLLGLSGRSADMREVEAAAESGDAAAELALQVFASRAREYVGAYLAVLNGAEAVIFGGGIGERSPDARRRILGGLDNLGIVLDDAANRGTAGREGRISATESRVEVWVVEVDEASEIARDVARVLG